MQFSPQFRFGTGSDKLLIILGTVVAMAHGAALPLMIIVFGDMIDMFVDRDVFAQALDDIWGNFTLLCNALPVRPEICNYTKDDFLNDPTRLQFV